MKFKKEELAKYKEALLKLKKHIEMSLDGLSESTHASGDSLSHYPDDPGYISNEEFERNKSLSIIDIDQNLLEQVEIALEKIEKGTYGKCEECGKPIGEGRLKAKPHSIYCVTCREQLEKDGKIK